MAEGNNKRNASIAAAATAGAVSLGYSALKGIAWLDRRRHGVDGELEDVARAALTFPEGVEHTTIRTRDGASMHVVAFGPRDARPLVLLHGVTLNASIWAGQFHDLGNRFRIIAPDWRGHGSTVPGRDGIGLPLLARDLVALLEHFVLRDALIVGHSMGGMALMHCAIDFPEIIRTHTSGLVFLSTAAGRVVTGPLSAPIRLGTSLAKRSPEAAGSAATDVPRDLGYAAVRLGFGAKPSAVWVEQCRQLLAAMSPIALSASTLSLLDHNVIERLSTIDLPTRVMVGSKDLVTPPKQSREIVAGVANSQLVTFDGAGHLLMLERREELNAALLSFSLELHREKKKTVTQP
jgi:pimeloyl-ACP methyl ester carboxylesterase